MLPDLDAWCRHFEVNAVADDGIDWDAPDRLPPDEARAIARSVAAFQVGEHSEGRGLLAFARRYDTDGRLRRITRDFVREEQHHAALLERFLRRHGLPVHKRVWTDAVFRSLRHRVPLEQSIAVLWTAELIAMAYYPVLAKQTASPLLRSVCRKIVADEAAQVRYQARLVRALEASMPPLHRAAAVAFRRALLRGTIAVVWVDHRAVMRRAGVGMSAFGEAVLAAEREALDSRAGAPAEVAPGLPQAARG